MMKAEAMKQITQKIQRGTIRCAAVNQGSTERCSLLTSLCLPKSASMLSQNIPLLNREVHGVRLGVYRAMGISGNLAGGI